MTHYIFIQKMISVADFIEVFIKDIIRYHDMSEILIMN